MRSSQTLAGRVLGNHLRGNDRSSTLRRSVTAIPLSDPGFSAANPNPRAVTTRRVVPDWMRDHLEVAIFPVGQRELVAEAERAAMEHFDPPLNLRGVTLTPARRRLRELRKELGRRVERAQTLGTPDPRR